MAGGAADEMLLNSMLFILSDHRVHRSLSYRSSAHHIIYFKEIDQ